MKPLKLIWVFITLFVFFAAFAEGGGRLIELHVAPGGDDGAAGTCAAPLATPTGARNRLRALRAAGGRFSGARVVFADGVYRLSSPLELDSRDSGVEGALVEWRTANRGKVVFSGAVVPEWRSVAADDGFLAALPESARSHVRVALLPGTGTVPGFHGGGEYANKRAKEVSCHLFRNGARLPLARWPNEGWAKTGEIVTNGCFRFSSPRMNAWTKERDLWAKGLWKYEWDDRREEVLKVDTSAGLLEVNAAGNPYGFAKDRCFFVFNAVSELDRSGEWVLDREGRRVAAWTDGAEAELAVATNLVCAAGVDHWTMEGFVFEGVRAEALRLENCSHVRLRASEIRLTGEWGVTVKGGEDVRVEGCDLHDLGEGGIRLEGGDRRTLAPGRHVADNCHIHHYGQVSHNYKPGVALVGVGNSALHNLVHHSDHQGLFFNGNDHRLAFNVVHDTCRYNDDAGAIYCCTRDWTQLGTVIEHNLVFWTGKSPHPTSTHAVYLDDWSSGVTVRGNILIRASLGVYIGGGQHCTVAGNLISTTEAGIRMNSRGRNSFAKATALAGAKSGIYRKLAKLRDSPEGALWRERYPGAYDLLGIEDPVFAHNAIYNVITGNVIGASGKFGYDPAVKDPKWSTIGDNLEVAGDPGFADYQGLDFSVKPGSPAARVLGKMRFAEMGLYASEWRLSPPVKFGEGVTRSAEPPRREHAPAKVRIDVHFPKLPAGESAAAEDFSGCEIPAWAKGTRVVAEFGVAEGTWREYSFAFTPKVDGAVSLLLMGAYGEKTLYDDFHVEGVPFGDPGCETNAPPWHEKPSVERVPLGDIDRPYGILVGDEHGFRAAEGRCAAAANHERQMRHTIVVKKGERVKVGFRARSFSRP